MIQEETIHETHCFKGPGPEKILSLRGKCNKSAGRHRPGYLLRGICRHRRHFRKRKIHAAPHAGRSGQPHRGYGPGRG